MNKNAAYLKTGIEFFELWRPRLQLAHLGSGEEEILGGRAQVGHRRARVGRPVEADAPGVRHELSVRVARGRGGRGRDEHLLDDEAAERMTDEDDRPLPDAARLQLLEDVGTPVGKVRPEALAGARVAPLAEVRVEVDADDADVVVGAQLGHPVAGPAVGVVGGADELLRAPSAAVVRVQLPPGVEHAAEDAVDEDDVDAPVAELVEVAHAAVLRHQEVDARHVDVAVLLVEVAQRLRRRKSDQQVGVLLPGGQDAHPAGTKDGLVRLLVEADIGYNFT